MFLLDFGPLKGFFTHSLTSEIQKVIFFRDSEDWIGCFFIKIRKEGKCMTHKRARVFGEVVRDILVGRGSNRPDFSQCPLASHTTNISHNVFSDYEFCCWKIAFIQQIWLLPRFWKPGLQRDSKAFAVVHIVQCIPTTLTFLKFWPQTLMCVNIVWVFSENSRMTKVHSLGTFPASCICILLHSIV